MLLLFAWRNLRSSLFIPSIYTFSQLSRVPFSRFLLRTLLLLRRRLLASPWQTLVQRFQLKTRGSGTAAARRPRLTRPARGFRQFSLSELQPSRTALPLPCLSDKMYERLSIEHPRECSCLAPTSISTRYTLVDWLQSAIRPEPGRRSHVRRQCRLVLF